ncbi:MAG: DUF2252 domain-containing protein [Gemmatimonadaceae bacterium]|nr:DUF2252 domain-containing protein [Gemmatimonadaceae bacterium]
MGPRLKRLQAFHATRDPERVQRKLARMRRDPFAFLRGTNVLFQEDWALGAGLLKKGPLAWQCGDLHAENVGSFRGGNRLTYFDLTDFDDAVLAPVLLDITRLCTSVLVAADLHTEQVAGGFDGRAMAAHLLATYRATLAEGKAWWIERGIATGLVRDLLRNLRERSRREFLETRARLAKRQLRVRGVHALPAPDEERARVAAAVQEALAATAPDLVVHDVARRIAGNGSLGVPRWVLLVEHAVPDARFALLDAKIPAPSPAVMHAPVQPEWPNEATRVVTVQRLMQAAPPALHHVVPFGEKALVLRELQPSEDRVRLDVAMARPRAVRKLLEQMAQLLAWGQLRASGWYGASGGDALQQFAQRDDWEGEVIAYAVRAATTNRQDWQAFCDNLP